MRLKEIRELAGNPNFISGIHNYCDRWCERCPFTARCLVYATEEADSDSDPASRDINNAAFWQKLTSIFQETREMIAAWAEENQVDLTPSTLAEIKQQKDKQRGEARNHPLARAAEEYAWAVKEWFEQDFREAKVFSDTAGDADERLELEEDVNDYVEVIRWYQFLIAAKMIRGLMSRIDEDEYPVAEPRDSDGSIKVALIAIDRSLGAWKLLAETRENCDSIRKLLLDLEQLRLRAEGNFPGARDFMRPGFDENLDMLH